jgi:antitoxin component HigA of HigAB toxin-antitoxin module
MRILRDGVYFSEGDDLGFVASIDNDDPSLYSFHPDDYRANKLAEIKSACEAELSALQAEYPESEVMSWDKQEREARAFVADSSASVPLISSLASVRGIGVPDLANRIIQKADAYTAAIGQALGRRQKLEDQLNAMTSWEEMAEINW